jgi:hypothetical protein
MSKTYFTSSASKHLAGFQYRDYGKLRYCETHYNPSQDTMQDVHKKHSRENSGFGGTSQTPQAQPSLSLGFCASDVRELGFNSPQLKCVKADEAREKQSGKSYSSGVPHQPGDNHVRSGLERFLTKYPNWGKHGCRN